MKQTAVEWYAEQAMKLEIEKAKGNMSISYMLRELINVLNQAKEMEKEQIIEAYCQGCFDIINQDDIFPRETSEQYYNQTFKSE